MDPNLTCLERAFQIARSGRCRKVDDIRGLLNREGYSDQQIAGRMLIKQLALEIAESDQRRVVGRSN